MTLILTTIDRIKELLGQLEATEAEPEGNDQDLIGELEAMVERGMAEMAAASAAPEQPVEAAPAATQGESGGADPGASVASRRSVAGRTGACVPRDLDRGRARSRNGASACAGSCRRGAGGSGKAAAGRPRPRSADKDIEKATDKNAERRRQSRPNRLTVSCRRHRRPEADRVANQSIRVNVDTLENLMTMVSRAGADPQPAPADLRAATRTPSSRCRCSGSSNVTSELQEGVMKTRMQPIGNAWQKLPRIVRDLSGELGKKIELEMHGADTELDRQVLDLIKDPLTHMVRNSADHGIETPAERAAAGKPETGHHRACTPITRAATSSSASPTTAAASTSSASAPRRSQRSRQRGRARQDERAADPASSSSAPGFSTAAKVTSVSGRGVGMDVVRTNIERIGGTIEINVGGGRGHHLPDQDPADPGDRLGADRGSRAASASPFRRLSVVELVRARANSEHRIESIKDTPVCGCATGCCR